ncbi:MAG: sulfatase-like hydrolase/transferase, partial [Phycisphaerae bacterium]|nr:sulfatase-like hydrolase/transferase [Phycisphaerae bacterium]
MQPPPLAPCRLWFYVLAIAALAPPVLSARDHPARRPNVIVMMVDDMGFAGPSVTPYGNPHYKTPGMDRLAREGMLFADFH